MERLTRFAEGATAAEIYGGKAGGEQMRRDVGAVLAELDLLPPADQAAGLAWSSEWEELQLDEEVLLFVEVHSRRQKTQLLARLHRFNGPTPRDVNTHRAGGPGWVAWQSTWDGALLPKDWQPLAFARVTTPIEGQLK
ncbi:hypothetical protein [Phenylobacterium sp. 58.2.17]|uniref:hypothetical protein n=1 Tax=Phenylobacterium sp. 58.2.17 TaxID=2969306 RepID=UPI002264DEF2|nr:hypothetical protein [Phenylobacterium sp. 58.2.17]MCX7586564.1 hypothetical protein [Phenylobacterium sp. 58.2.17]